MPECHEYDLCYLLNDTILLNGQKVRFPNNLYPATDEGLTDLTKDSTLLAKEHGVSLCSGTTCKTTAYNLVCSRSRIYYNNSNKLGKDGTMDPNARDYRVQSLHNDRKNKRCAR